MQPPQSEPYSDPRQPAGAGEAQVRSGGPQRPVVGAEQKIPDALFAGRRRRSQCQPLPVRWTQSAWALPAFSFIFH